MKTRDISKLEPLLDDFVEQFLSVFGDKFNLWKSKEIKSGGRNYAFFEYGSLKVYVRVHRDYSFHHARVHMDLSYRQISWTPVVENKDYSSFLKKVADEYDREKIRVANDQLSKRLKEDSNSLLENLGLLGVLKVNPRVSGGKKYSETDYNYEIDSSIQRLGEDNLKKLLGLIERNSDGRIKVSLYFKADDLPEIAEDLKSIKAW